jgi:hypothetical protein
MVPSPAPAFPFAGLVFWVGIGVQIVLCRWSFLTIRRAKAPNF